MPEQPNASCAPHVQSYNAEPLLLRLIEKPLSCAFPHVKKPLGPNPQKGKGKRKKEKGDSLAFCPSFFSSSCVCLLLLFH